MKKLAPKQVARGLARARIVVYVVLVLVIGYHLWRYDIVQIPREAISPLDGFPAGTRLIVDVRTDAFEPGDAVLYRAPDGELFLGRVGSPPPSAPAEMHAACASGAFWIEKDNADAAGKDSVLLGPIRSDAIAGRIRGSVPW